MVVEPHPVAVGSLLGGTMAPESLPRLAAFCLRLAVALTSWLAAYIVRHRPTVCSVSEAVDLLTPLMADRWQEELRLVLLDREWHVPPARMKAKRLHIVPLSDRAIALLQDAKRLHPKSELIFPGVKSGRPLSDMTLTKCLRDLGFAESTTCHGLRSSFRDWCGDRTSFPREVAEAALAHKVGDETERAYRRSDALEKRRKLMQAWADYCESKNSGNVLNIAARRKA